MFGMTRVSKFDKVDILIGMTFLEKMFYYTHIVDCDIKFICDLPDGAKFSSD